MMENFYADSFKAFDENYKRITEEIAVAAAHSGRNEKDITLLAATKTVSADVINYAVSEGIRAIGENRVQELLNKYDALDKDKCDIHFIGRVQTNKLKYLVDKVSCIQSVDSLKAAQILSSLCTPLGVEMSVLIEVNIGREPQKGGVMPEELTDFIESVRMLPGVKIKGFMTIPPVCDKISQLETYFSDMNEYYVDIRDKKIDNVNMDCLSMGMSSDFSYAIKHGANMVRIGTSLFGKRV